MLGRMRNDSGDAERTEALEIEADLALLVAALGGGPASPTDTDHGTAAAREGGTARSDDPALRDAA